MTNLIRPSPRHIQQKAQRFLTSAQVVTTQIGRRPAVQTVRYPRLSSSLTIRPVRCLHTTLPLKMTSEYVERVATENACPGTFDRPRRFRPRAPRWPKLIDL